MGSVWHWHKAALCTALALAQPLPYQAAYRTQALAALRLVYDIRFHEALAQLRRLEGQYGPYAGTTYLQALLHSWQIELDPATTWFDNAWAKAIARTDSLLRCCSKAPLETYFIGFANRALHVRRLYVRGYLLRSVWEACSLLALLEGLRKHAPDYPEMQFELGLYEYYIAYFKQNYPIMRPILVAFPPGDKVRGLSRLAACARDSFNYTQTEAMYFLGYIYLYQEKVPDSALHWLSRLTTQYPRNSLFRRMQAEALYEKRRYREARAVIMPWLEHYEESCPKPPCYLITSTYPTSEAAQAYGVLGMCYREEGAYAEAEAAFGKMDTLLERLRTFPAPTWARLQREVALYYQKISRSDLAQARLARIQARDDVPAYLKRPLP